MPPSLDLTRKLLVSLVVLINFSRIKTWRILPGETEGNWNSSPTTTNLVLLYNLVFLNNSDSKIESTIENSSIKITSGCFKSVFRSVFELTPIL